MKDLLKQLKDKVKLMEKLDYNPSEKEELKSCIDELQKFYDRNATTDQRITNLPIHFSPN